MNPQRTCQTKINNVTNSIRVNVCCSWLLSLFISLHMIVMARVFWAVFGGIQLTWLFSILSTNRKRIWMPATWSGGLGKNFTIVNDAFSGIRPELRCSWYWRHWYSVILGTGLFIFIWQRRLKRHLETLFYILISFEICLNSQA